MNRLFESRSAIAAALAQIHSIEQQINYTRESLSPLEKLVEDYRNALEIGGTDVLAFYLAIREYNNQRIELLKLQQERVEAWVDLENAAGACLSRLEADEEAHAAGMAVPMKDPAATQENSQVGLGDMP